VPLQCFPVSNSQQQFEFSLPQGRPKRVEAVIERPAREYREIAAILGSGHHGHDSEGISLTKADSSTVLPPATLFF
jgi:hypothetical protein